MKTLGLFTYFLLPFSFICSQSFGLSSLNSQGALPQSEVSYSEIQCHEPHSKTKDKEVKCETPSFNEGSPSCPIEVLGVGTPSWDHVYRINEEYLIENQLLKQDTVRFNTCRFNRALNAARKMGGGICSPGGSCANTLRGLGALGVVCGLVGIIGDDAQGDLLLEHLRETGIHPLYKRKASSTFEILTCITPDRKRSFCLHFNPQLAVTQDDITADYFTSPKVIHLQAYSLRGGHCIEKCIELTKNFKKILSLDLCDAALTSKYKERILGFLDNVDLLFLSCDEAYALTQLPPEQAIHFLNNFCQTVILKQGEHGCTVSTRERTFHSSSMKSFAVDATGAGDFFCSGFLYGILKGMPLEKCAYFGNLCGGTSVEHIGAIIPKARWHELANTFDQED
jgi:sugar/nucleoside kinase (ribokinase family)